MTWHDTADWLMFSHSLNISISQSLYLSISRRLVDVGGASKRKQIIQELEKLKKEG